jgi:5-methylthioadenosine/S-adenosylhomocysteine deaminase
MRESLRIGAALSVFAVSVPGCNTTPSVEPERCVDDSFITVLDGSKRILVRNAALVITMDPDLGDGPLGTLEGADVLFDSGTIVAVGKGLPDAGSTSLDASGKIVMPGIVDVHNHLWQSLIRGCATDNDLLGWLERCVYPVEAVGITEQEAYAAVRLSAADLIGTGVTTVVDDSHAFTPAFVRGNVTALYDSGMRFVFAHCGREDRVDEIRQLHKELDAAKPSASIQVCSHPGTSLLGWLTHAATLAKELDVPLNLHLLENIKQREDQPVTAMIDAHAFEGKLLVNHAIHLTDDEIAMLASKDVHVAYNPLSNMRLASGIMPIVKMKAYGMKIGLGLDGGTNDASDAFANMRAAVGLQRVLSLDATVYPTVTDVLRLATMGGAEVLDLQNSIGSLTPGKKADLIILDPKTSNFAPRWDWLSQIVFNAQPTNVEYVFVDGKVRKACGRVLHFPRAEMIQSAENAAKRIKAALQKKE